MSGQAILDGLTFVFGGFLLSSFYVIGVFCGISALLAISDENRYAFRVLTRVFALFLIVLGLLLPVRSVSVLGTFLAIVLAALLQRPGVPTLPYFIGGIVAVALSLVFWIHQNAQSFDFPFLKFADLGIFVLLPTVFLLVKSAQGSQKLTQQKGLPTIPLRLLLARLADWIAKIFPTDH
jgi:hypothetical protein